MVKLSILGIQTISTKAIRLRVQLITLTTIIPIAINTNIHMQLKTKNLLIEREIKKTMGLIKLIQGSLIPRSVPLFTMSNLTRYSRINGRTIIWATIFSIKDLTNQRLFLTMPSPMLIYSSPTNLPPTLPIKSTNNLRSKNRRAAPINRRNSTMQSWVLTSRRIQIRFRHFQIRRKK